MLLALSKATKAPLVFSGAPTTPPRPDGLGRWIQRPHLGASHAFAVTPSAAMTVLWRQAMGLGSSAAEQCDKVELQYVRLIEP